MIFESKIQEIGVVALPVWNGDQVYMQEFDLASPNVPERWAPMVLAMIAATPFRTGKAYLTVDEKEIRAGQSHRRGGAHVDGNYTHDWRGGGSGWRTGTPGRMLTPEAHKAAYCSPLGGLLLASSFAACVAWPGLFKGVPGQGGDCEHLRPQFREPMELHAGRVYWMNSMGIHKSMPLPVDVRRTLVRITLPTDAEALV